MNTLEKRFAPFRDIIIGQELQHASMARRPIFSKPIGPPAVYSTNLLKSIFPLS